MRPQIPAVPSHLDSATRNFLQKMRESIFDLHTVMPPLPPSNLLVTPVAYGNSIKFTRASDADRHIVMWNSSPTLDGAASVDVGQSAEWSHDIGKDGVKRYYWVKSLADGKESQLVGPISGVTLASNVPLAVALNPTPPPQSDLLVTDSSVHQVIPELERE